jgi:hypothetical protein
LGCGQSRDIFAIKILQQKGTLLNKRHCVLGT